MSLPLRTTTASTSQDTQHPCIRQAKGLFTVPFGLKGTERRGGPQTERPFAAAPKKRLGWGPKLRSESIEEVGSHMTPFSFSPFQPLAKEYRGIGRSGEGKDPAYIWPLLP